MKNLLILSQWCDYLSTNVYHYSISKGFNIAAGFTTQANTYYMTLGKSQDYELPETISDNSAKRIVHLINVNEITHQFIETLDYILFIKEVEMFNLLEKIPILKELCLLSYKTQRKQKVGVKSDSLAWIRTENTICKQLFGFDCHEFAIRCLDLLYVQTPEFKAVDFKRFGKDDQRIFKKIFISPMGVNNYIETIKGPSPYSIDHHYCVKDYSTKTSQLKEQSALYPIPLIPLLDLPDDNKEKLAALADFNRNKTILIYSGRLKMHGAIEMLKNIMKSLGNNYELHIFPGSFNLPVAYRQPGEEDVRYSGRHSFSVLRDRIFNDSTNIIVHHPFTEDDKGRYLTFSNIGLDFSQSRPNNVKSCQGNCKLLEYCYYGLKVVAEKNINNSHLVKDGKNGILLENIGSVEDYVKAIKKMEAQIIDSEFTKLQTIKTNNWDIIAKDVLDDFQNYNNTK